MSRAVWDRLKDSGLPGAGRPGARGGVARRFPPRRAIAIEWSSRAWATRTGSPVDRAIDNAEAGDDPTGSDRAHAEMDALLRELRRAVGLGGRDRRTGSDAERARINVVRSLRRAIAAVAVQAPLLGAHLDASVRTGGRCIYLPDPSAAMSWRVERPDGRSA